MERAIWSDISRVRSAHLIGMKLGNKKFKPKKLSGQIDISGGCKYLNSLTIFTEKKEARALWFPKSPFCFFVWNLNTSNHFYRVFECFFSAMNQGSCPFFSGAWVGCLKHHLQKGFGLK